MQDYDIFELKGENIFNAIRNMIEQLMTDNNEIVDLNDITLDRIIEEVDVCGLRFSEKGDIICNN